MDPTTLLTTGDRDLALTWQAVLSRAREFAHQQDKNRAVLIANAVWSGFK